jgi:hypothetical protein
VSLHKSFSSLRVINVTRNRVSVTYTNTRESDLIKAKCWYLGRRFWQRISAETYHSNMDYLITISVSIDLNLLSKTLRLGSVQFRDIMCLRIVSHLT